ncbi:MAG TPA: transposase [Candidatus Paceibacterota bacterium]|nr:transposase [Candidatus Paceibacterota bacterium]
MGRALRVDVGNVVYHVINRGNFRAPLFRREKEYDNFMRIVEDAKAIAPMRILAYCLMPNHWHMALYPENDGDLSRFMQRVTLTHTQQYHARTGTQGYGHIYQGRYKSFPVQTDAYFLNLIRYIERNAARASLAERADGWKWSSAHVRVRDIRGDGDAAGRSILSPWPLAMPEDYPAWLNEPVSGDEIENIRHAVQRNRPYGSTEWTAAMIRQFGLENSIRDPWRPKGKKGT